MVFKNIYLKILKEIMKSMLYFFGKVFWDFHFWTFFLSIFEK
jgi:hypothetical protein